jgi:hypothetical protein
MQMDKMIYRRGFGGILPYRFLLTLCFLILRFRLLHKINTFAAKNFLNQYNHMIIKGILLKFIYVT